MKQVYTTTNETKDGVKVTLHEAASFPRIPADGEEVEAYIARGRALESGKKLVAIDITISGDEAEIRYEYEPVKFERIRRITGYLVGTLDRFNDAKRAEESQRVKHGTEVDLRVGSEYSIDLTALLIDKVGSHQAISTIKDGEMIEIEFGQSLLIEHAQNPEDPYIDLYVDRRGIAVCDGETVMVEYLDDKKVVLRSMDDPFNAISFELSRSHAAICLNNFAHLT